jgi:hypothetical protein
MGGKHWGRFNVTFVKSWILKPVKYCMAIIESRHPTSCSTKHTNKRSHSKPKFPRCVREVSTGKSLFFMPGMTSSLH